MKPGEVHLANFPFGNIPGTKLRPHDPTTPFRHRVPTPSDFNNDD